MLRGVAILAVIFHHVGPLDDGWLSVLQSNSRYGVALFFSLSGFLICSLMLREERRNGQVALADFYIRRGLRLFPLYYAVLGLYCVIVLGLGMFSPENQMIFKERLTYNALYLSNFLPVTGPFFFAWSLAVEEQFYLVFGQLFRWLKRSWLIALVMLLLVAKPILAFWGVLEPGNLGIRIVFSYSEPLLMGVLGGFALDNRLGFKLGGWAGSPPILWGLAVGLTVLLCTVTLHDKSGLPAQLSYVMMTLLIMGCAIRPAIPTPGYALLSHVGVVCYGIYLLHMLVIMVVQRTMTSNPVLTLIIATVGVYVLASLVYRYFERPILKYKDRFSHA